MSIFLASLARRSSAAAGCGTAAAGPAGRSAEYQSRARRPNLCWAPASIGTQGRLRLKLWYSSAMSRQVAAAMCLVCYLQPAAAKDVHTLSLQKYLKGCVTAFAGNISLCAATNPVGLAQMHLGIGTLPFKVRCPSDLSVRPCGSVLTCQWDARAVHQGRCRGCPGRWRSGN